MNANRIVLRHMGQTLLLGAPVNASDLETLEAFLLFNFGPSHLYVSRVGFVSANEMHKVMNDRTIVIAPGESKVVLGSDAYQDWLAELNDFTLQNFRDNIIPKEGNMMKLAIEGYSSFGQERYEVEVRLHRLGKKVAFKL